MASEVSICNLALTRVGEAGSITSIKPPEGSVHAKVCAVLYPVSVGILLEAHDWRFATRRAALTEIQTKELHGWRGLFALHIEEAPVARPLIMLSYIFRE